jgi:hypothetical protein
MIPHFPTRWTIRKESEATLFLVITLMGDRSGTSIASGFLGALQGPPKGWLQNFTGTLPTEPNKTPMNTPPPFLHCFYKHDPIHTPKLTYLTQHNPEDGDSMYLQNNCNSTHIHTV